MSYCPLSAKVRSPSLICTLASPLPILPFHNRSYYSVNAVCKYLSREIKDRLQETELRASEVIRLGQGVDESKKKSFTYAFSFVPLLASFTCIRSSLLFETLDLILHASSILYQIFKKSFSKCRETRLTEILHEPPICDRIKDYQVHKERLGSLRFAKGRSQTFQTLEDLVYEFSIQIQKSML